MSIPLSSAGNSRVLRINGKALFANKCAGGSSASLRMLFGMMDLPMPVSKNAYTTHNQEIEKQAKLQAEDSMAGVREEGRRLYDSESDDDIVDVIVSCDGTWQ